jgi:hypothetical protein
MWASAKAYGWPDGAKLELAWLPAAPLAYILLCQYVVSSFSNTWRELLQLDGMRYELKTA